MARARTGLTGRWGRLAVGALVVVVAVGIGALSGRGPELALPAAVLVLGIGVVVAEPRAFPVLAVPGVLAMSRVAGVVSVADVVLIAATVVALILVRGRLTAPVRTLLWAGTIYLALSAPTLLLNPFSANLVEWAHELVMVLGSIVVGYAVGRSGGARTALFLYVLAACAIGAAAVAVALTGFATSGEFQPAYLPEGLHKNFIGGALAAAAVIVFAWPAWLNWPGAFVHLAFAVCVAGILAAQSRQGLVALVAGMLVVSLRPGSRQVGNGRLTWWLLPPAAIVVGMVTVDQFRTMNQHNSFFQRLDWFAEAMQVWQVSPAFGVGMRWWYTDRFDERFQPPNAVLEVLTTTGLVGLAGFVAMFAIACVVLVRLEPAYGTVALAVIVVRLVQTQLDLFWVAGASSFLWIVAGLVIGVRDRDREGALAAGIVPRLARGSGEPVEHSPEPVVQLGGGLAPHPHR